MSAKPRSRWLNRERSDGVSARPRLRAKATNLAALKSHAIAGYAPYEEILSKAFD
jgi:hypothetical protein